MYTCFHTHTQTLYIYFPGYILFYFLWIRAGNETKASQYLPGNKHYPKSVKLVNKTSFYKDVESSSSTNKN